MPYSSAGFFSERSDMEAPTSSFADLYNKDLVHAARHVGCCQLARLEVSPYQRGLLERGLNHRAQGEFPDRRMEQGMGYSASVGIMIMDELAGHWSMGVNKKIKGMERHIQMLITS